MADVYMIEYIHMVQFLSKLQFLLSGENANPSRSKLKPESQFSWDEIRVRAGDKQAGTWHRGKGWRRQAQVGSWYFLLASRSCPEPSLGMRAQLASPWLWVQPLWLKLMFLCMHGVLYRPRVGLTAIPSEVGRQPYVYFVDEKNEPRRGKAT